MYLLVLSVCLCRAPTIDITLRMYCNNHTLYVLVWTSALSATTSYIPVKFMGNVEEGGK
jgi:hypothetical protein